MKEERLREIEAEEEIEFKGMTQKYGRAYWHVGVKRKEGGVITDLYMVPGQQPDKEKILHYEPKSEQVTFEVEPVVELIKSTDRMNRLSHSRTRYCEEHDMVEESFCMPADATSLSIREYSNAIEIRIDN